MAKKWIKVDGVVRRLHFEQYWDSAKKVGALFPYVKLYGERLRLTHDYINQFTTNEKEACNGTVKA